AARSRAGCRVWQGSAGGGAGWQRWSPQQQGSSQRAGARWRGPGAVAPPSRVRYSARFDQEVGASVLGPACLGVLGADGALLSVADDRDPIGLNALGDEVVHGRFRAPLAEGEVVFVGAALVAVSFDEDEH